MNDSLENMIKGLILHYLHQGTVEEAIEQGREGRLPKELLASLPVMISEITSASGAIILGAQTEESALKELAHRAKASGSGAEFNKNEVRYLIKLTVDFISQYMTDGEGAVPVPELPGFWYQYGQ